MSKRTESLNWSDKDARAALDRYEVTVRMIARKLRPVANLGQALDEEDLYAEGRVAVLEALSTYQGFGIQEQTWVRTRIRQRMIDAIRRLDLRTRDELRLAVRHASGATNPGEEHEKGRAVAARRLVSLDAPLDGGMEPMLSRVPDSAVPLADELVYGADQHRKLLDALANLPERQREAIELAIFDGMALREIGTRMGISESRVCQLQKRAVEHLSRALSETAPVVKESRAA